MHMVLNINNVFHHAQCLPAGASWTWMHFLSQSFLARRILEAWLIISECLNLEFQVEKEKDCNKTKTECFEYTYL